MLRAIGLAVLLSACHDTTPATKQIRFLHTFGPEETELFNKLIADRGLAVESSLVPFARGQQVIGEILRTGTTCPDLIRIDATWLSGLHAAKLLAPVPANLAQLDWTPEAIAMVGTPPRGVPQTVDGLVVVRDASRPAPTTPAIDDLVTAARATRTPSSPYPLGVRSDGYWFVPWLRAEGIDLAPSSIEGDGATRALAKFAALFGDVAPPPPPAGSEAPDELRRWSSHEVAYWITGPWQLGVLEVRDRLVIGPLAKAPRGGQVLVVPACARDPEGGWRLASALVDVEMQTRFASELTMVPTRVSALASTTPLVKSIYDALRTAEPLPQAPHTPLLFDDLNPALAAVIARDATPEEAIEGIRRGWKRIARSSRLDDSNPDEPTQPDPTAPRAPQPEPMNGSGSRPANGSGSRPANDSGSRPANGSGSRPANGSGSEPANGSGSRPASGSGSRPANGSGSRPANDSGSRPANGSGSEPANGSSSRPASGSGSAS